MSTERMCRWHTDCDTPLFEKTATTITDYNTKHPREINVPRCKSCGRSPPLEQLIPKLAKDWQPNPMPEDKDIGDLNLHRPASVFRECERSVPQHRAALLTQKDAIEIEVNGAALRFEMVGDPAINGSQLRLMRLSPQHGNDPVCADLMTFEDDNMPEFEALSYSLGGQSRMTTPTTPVYIGKHKDIILLTETCEGMLKFLSPYPKDPARLLWFDFLCINQSEFEERDRQLPKMRSIYSGCTRVIVYLGNDIVDRLDSGRHRPRYWLHELDQVFAWNGDVASLTLERILARGYFQRTWIIQEILLADTVIIPIHHCSFRASLVALNLLKHNAREWSWQSTPTPWLEYAGQAPLHATNLYGALRLTWKSQARDRRDKVYGVLGLISNDPEFEPDSSLSWSSTFIGTCAHLIKRGYTELLLKSRGASCTTDQLSWPPDWADPGISNPVDTTARNSLRAFRHCYFLDTDDPFCDYVDSKEPPSEGNIHVICFPPVDFDANALGTPLFSELNALTVVE